LDALQAAVLRVKLPHLDNWAKDRQSRAEHYRKAFEELQLAPVVTAPATPQEQRVHVYNQFTIRCRLRDELKQFLIADGIPTEIYYPLYLHLQGAFSNLGYSVGDFPVAETASREVLSLPVYSELTDAQQDCVIQSIARFCAQQLYNRDECSGERTSL